MSYHASRRTLLAAAALAAVTAGGAASAARGSRPTPDRPRPVPDDPRPAPGDPRPGDRAPGPEQAARLLGRMSLEEKVGQLFVSRAYGHSATDPDPADAEKNLAQFGVRTAAELVSRYHLGGVIYFAWAQNTRTPHQIAELSNGLQRAAAATGAGVPLLLSTDQEHGIIARIGKPATLLPGAMALGAGRSTDAARRAGRIAGTELASMGIRQDYAPVADVNVNPANPVIGVRSFGSDPRAVAGLVAAQVRGYQGAGVAATAKHFPGHGDTETDSHVGLPVMRHTRAQWEELDEPPFRAAVAAGVDAVMTAHIVFPALDPSQDPATLSYPVVTGILRERLGFRGVVVTDALDMAGVRQKYGDDRVPVLALKAGCDQLLNAPDLALAQRAVLAAVAAGELSEARIEESVLRILELKARRGLFDDPYTSAERVDAATGTAAHLAAADAIAAGTTTLLANPDKLLPLDAGAAPRLLVTGTDPASPSGTTGPPTSVLARELTALGCRASAVAPARAVAAAPGHAAVLVCTYNVPDGESPQRTLVTELLATGVPVVVVAIRNPYDPARLPRCAAELATYSWTDVELRAAARVITGAARPAGRLPVPVPGRYPLGHGLAYG
ncbi:glycoside hydrolase family 3 C-terminal domain-containing protein [Streptomyces sp. KCTC 0041BP]|uniref:glycoside hydrolase family 3 protein n=1 Tax=Streptomyces sp. KCTC 0041BP TaxID=201500 RepID=UPI001AE3B850|nr:glycoside hydrolase family 3 protein [Streptomyces sp. KCTC 0041BP]MBP0934376.1 glycoside hydrolase family 3 C-terminal domain-containing protein [Streptomyces sp. KCTC 0041BP]